MPINRRFVHAGLEQVAEGQPAAFDQPGVDAAHVDVDRRVVVNDVRGLGGLGLAHDPPERADQVPQFDLLDRLLAQIANSARAGRWTAADSAAAKRGCALPKCWRRRDTSCTPTAGGPTPAAGSSISSSTSSLRGSTCCDLISISVLARARKSPTAFTSSCSSTADILQILIGDLGDGNVDDLDLVLSHQVQEQIQRSAEQV